jgi:hypothetical protein
MPCASTMLAIPAPTDLRAARSDTGAPTRPAAEAGRRSTYTRCRGRSDGVLRWYSLHLDCWLVLTPTEMDEVA